jgi:putative transposon-encoded protein
MNDTKHDFLRPIAVKIYLKEVFTGLGKLGKILVPFDSARKNKVNDTKHDFLGPMGAKIGEKEVFEKFGKNGKISVFAANIHFV